MVRQYIAVMRVLCLSQAAFTGLSSHKAEYVGGTWTALKQGTEGRLDVSDEKTRSTAETFEFRTGKKIEYESDEARKHLGN